MKIIHKKNFDQEMSPLLLPFFEDGQFLPEYLNQWHKNLVDKKVFNNKLGESLDYFSGESKTPLQTILWSLGKKSEMTTDKMRNTIALAIKRIRRNPCPEIALYWNMDLNEYAGIIGEALAMANYSMALFHTGKDKQDAEEKVIQKITVVSTEISKVAKYDLEEGLKIGLAVNFTRDLINGPSNYIHPETFAEHASEVASTNRYKIKIFDRKQLEKMKMGALLAVNDGSHHGAKLIVMEYLPLGKRQDPIALVGKGVTFDTGGVNLKPTNGITDMKKDMSGAAVVLGVCSLLKELDVKQNVVALIPLTDNSVDSKAIKPSDIITSYSGQTIEINNTDAEGRLILADAISYAVKHYKPSAIIDLATLTGACCVALGDQYAGMFGNNDKLKDRLKNAGIESDELVWEMPIHDIHRKAMKGTISDLVNVDTSGMAGASTAAAFLEAFTEKTDWVHLDIAGPAMPKKFKDFDFNGSGAAFGLRLITQFLRNIK